MTQSYGPLQNVSFHQIELFPQVAIHYGCHHNKKWFVLPHGIQAGTIPDCSPIVYPALHHSRVSLENDSRVSLENHSSPSPYLHEEAVNTPVNTPRHSSIQREPAQKKQSTRFQREQFTPLHSRTAPGSKMTPLWKDTILRRRTLHSMTTLSSGSLVERQS